MKTLIIFAFAVSISFCYFNEPSIDSFTTFKCPDDKKIKIGEDVCAIATTKDGSTDGVTNAVYVKKKSCGKNKKCEASGGSGNDIIYTCKKSLKLLKINKKCNYNAECYTGFCDNGKCAAYGESEDCNGENQRCGPGKYCKKTGTSTYKCANYVKENEHCSSEGCVILEVNVH